MNTEHAEPEQEPTTDAVVETAPVPAEPVAVIEPAAPAAPEAKKAKSTRKPSPLGAVVSGGERDNVSLAACIVKNKFNRKSLSVHHVQRRLAELGYNDAASDKDGWYGDLTVLAVQLFQGAEGLEATGLLDMATLEALFHDDANVTVIP